MAEEVIPSFNAQLRALARGQSLARAERFDIDEPPLSGINDVLMKMRRGINAAVSRIRESTGSNFRVESGVMLTDDNTALIAVVTVTRQ
jgi:hypothetical protein